MLLFISCVCPQRKYFSFIVEHVLEYITVPPMYEANDRRRGQS